MAPNARGVSSGGIELRDLSRGFCDRTVLDRITLSIPTGQFVALLGRSGSGKSTLLRALAGLDYDVDGSGNLRVPSKVGVVFQDSRLLPWQNVLQNVLFGQPRSARAAAVRVLAEVGLAGRERAWPAELSGGEQQRVSLARSLVGAPELLLADEPFGALDALTRIKMHDLLRDLIRRRDPTVLLVTHDVDEAVALADRVLVLDSGSIVLDTPVDLPAVRDPTDPEFQRVRRALLDALGVEPLAI
ncbi:ABC transporter ATP-binding protein [Mycobacterium sp. DL440]|uniref:ABC transporter ATP-binding protein n=1 Tax=Mycobacterium sp. DL440 TaxID=2675523 RepID=UPI00142232BA|nr:ABC transporter ATP-binding protein [Mycobacterium sp. DL440]